jgi:hypothetical protein
MMVRAIVVMIMVLAVISSSRSADLPFAPTDRSKSSPARGPAPSSAAASKPLPIKSPVPRGKIKTVKFSRADKASSPKRGISPTGLALTVRTSESTSAVAGEDEWKTYVSKYMSEVVSLGVYAPEVIAAVQEQNVANAGLTPNQIEALDRQWRAERKVNGGPLSNAKMFNPTSQFLKGFKAAANGAIVEIFIMDNKGLNVAQTDPTSDLMQGDEDKWQKTFGAGPWMTFVDQPEEEDGKKTVQVSATLVDNDVAIGAMTVSLDLDKVPMK